VTRRRTRRGRARSRWTWLVLAAWAVMLALALIVTVLHVIGWIAATAAIAAAAYTLGRRHAVPAARPARRVPAAARTAAAAVPARTVPARTVPAAVPAQAPQDATVLREVAAGLSGLGWRAADARAAASAAYSAVSADPGRQLDTAAVLRQALGAANRAERIAPPGR